MESLSEGTTAGYQQIHDGIIHLVDSARTETVRKLVEGGIDLKDVNVGNMHFSEGKKQISSKVYVDDQDLTDLRFIKQRGVNVFIQDVPGDQKEQIPD